MKKLAILFGAFLFMIIVMAEFNFELCRREIMSSDRTDSTVVKILSKYGIEDDDNVTELDKIKALYK